MSIFVALQAFDDADFIAAAKITIIATSLISAILGLLSLHLMLPKKGMEIAK